MSGTNTTIQDDNLTFITYSAGWINSSDNRYVSSNYHATTKFGSTVIIKFEGNGIEVTGAMKPEYGNFSVELNGRPALNASSFSRAQTFRQKLFHLRDLPNGLHAVRVINTGTGFDVDTFTFLTSPTQPTSTTSDTNPTNIIIGAIFAAVGVFALIILIILLRRLPRYKREKRRLYGGASAETLVQVHPYDYVPPNDSANRRSKYNDQDLPDVPASAFSGSPISANPPSTHRRAPPVTSGPIPSHAPHFLANDIGQCRSTTITPQSPTSSVYSTESITQRPPVRRSTLPVYTPEAPLRPVSVRSSSVGSGSIKPAVRPLSIAGRPGSIRPTIPESPFDSKRVCALYTTQPTIREYSKRDTIFGKRRMDDRGRVDLLADDVPGTAPAQRAEFSSPRQAPRPPMGRSASLASTVYDRSPQPPPDHDGPPRLTLNTTMMSSITEPIEWSPSISTMRFASRPNSGVTQTSSTTPSRSNSKGESLFSPSEKEKRSSIGSKGHKERRRSSLIPSVPPLPPLPEPEPEPSPYVPLAPPPPVTIRQKRAGGSFGSMNSASGLVIGTPESTMLNSSPTVKDKPFVVVGLPSSPRPSSTPRSIQGVPSRSSPRTLSQSSPLAPFALGTNASANGTPRSSGMRMVDLETGVVGVVEEKRAWARVRSMMGVVGDVHKDEALFEMVGTPPPLPSPALGQGQGQGQWQWQRQRQGQGQGRLQAPCVALPGKVGGVRVLKKPAPLALDGLSNFESSVYGNNSANDIRRRFVREAIVTTKSSTPSDIDPNTNTNTNTHGWKKMSILQSAVINGRANKDEVELVTGMKMDI